MATLAGKFFYFYCSSILIIGARKRVLLHHTRKRLASSTCGKNNEYKLVLYFYGGCQIICIYFCLLYNRLWYNHPILLQYIRLGCTPVIVETKAQDNFILTADQLRAALTPRSRLLILCTPSNPTGSVYPKEALEAIAEVVKEHPR